MKHEGSISSIFNDYMNVIAEANNFPFYPFDLDGQDRYVCGDALFLSTDKFCIVEYKYTSNEISNENKKEKAVAVCLCLEGNDELKLLHDKCHYIAFESEETLMANIYRNEICNQKVLSGITKLSSLQPMVSNRYHLHEFAKIFFTDTNMFSSLPEFKKYLKLLLSCGGGDEERELELVINNYNDDRSGVKTKKVRSLLEAQKWVIKNYDQKKELHKKLKF